MDMVISQYDAEYLHLLIRYRKALLQRNVLLRKETEPDSDFIGVYETEMAGSGEFIYRKRKEFVAEFMPIFRQIYAQLACADENVELIYQSHCEESPLLKILQDNRAKDRVMGFSLMGVHRDDLDMKLNGFPIKREGSQGQNKTFMISMKLAQFNFLKGKGNSHVPILLLDDIFDKLDERRVEQIVDMVSGNRFGQIFITDTNRDFLASVLGHTGKDYRMFNVKAGEVTLI